MFPNIHPIDSSRIVIYKMRGLSGTGGISTGAFMRHFLILPNASWQSSFQQMDWFLRKSLNNGSQIAVRCDMNLAM